MSDPVLNLEILRFCKGRFILDYPRKWIDCTRYHDKCHHIRIQGNDCHDLIVQATKCVNDINILEITLKEITSRWDHTWIQLTNSFDNRRCLRLLKLCRMFLLLLIHQNTRGFWTNNAHRNTRMPDGSRCRDITDTTHATAYSRARTVERWNGTSGTPELRNNIYLNRVSAQL